MNPYQEIQQGEITVRSFKKDVQDDAEGVSTGSKQGRAQEPR